MRRVVAAALLLAAGIWAPGPATAEIGRIKTVAGQATVARAGAVSPAVPGFQLLASDVIETGRDGRVGVIFIDNSRFAIGPGSRVGLSQFEFDDATHVGHSLTTVDRGALAVVSGQIAKENKDAMRVRTPTSLLAARGTRFVVDVK
jgi:hypothetical protein